jgi:hypothetical protein
MIKQTFYTDDPRSLRPEQLLNIIGLHITAAKESLRSLIQIQNSALSKQRKPITNEHAHVLIQVETAIHRLILAQTDLSRLSAEPYKNTDLDAEGNPIIASGQSSP